MRPGRDGRADDDDVTDDDVRVEGGEVAEPLLRPEP
jgi:hypothetical protein